MEIHEEPPDSVIEEIAAILATGYLRLRKARIQGKAANPSPHSNEELLDSGFAPSSSRKGAPSENGGCP